MHNLPAAHRSTSTRTRLRHWSHQALQTRLPLPPSIPCPRHSVQRKHPSHHVNCVASNPPPDDKKCCHTPTDQWTHNAAEKDPCAKHASASSCYSRAANAAITSAKVLPSAIQLSAAGTPINERATHLTHLVVAAAINNIRSCTTVNTDDSVAATSTVL